MCVLICRVGDSPILAANRDEVYTRPFTAPRRWVAETPFWAPRDEDAGGTWLGVNAAGLVAAVTNRSLLPQEPGRPSRGALVAGVLARRSLDAARDWLDRELRGPSPNPFQLVAARRGRAFLCAGGPDGVELAELRAGIHVLSNLHERGELRLELPADVDAVRLQKTLADRTPRLPGDHAICKVGSWRGTVAAAVIEPGRRFLFAAGPPGEVPFEAVASYPG
ncbi:MAG: NRDE family protein [Planctomycetota bacterium]